ncbi:LysR family transcriptional regulator [Dickeya lacustris]|nr:LysR family transcriptional regulator [Dickeya lacustris]
MNIKDIDLNLLKVFEALHEEGGASRASLRLGLTQSAVSAALRRLRVVYQDPLFQRTGRGLMPTRRANELKPLISEALNRCRQSLAIITSNTAYHDRTVTIGLSDDYEIAIGRDLMERVATQAPGMRLIFRQTHSQIAGEMLMSRTLDLAIASGGFSSRTLGRHVLGTGSYACLIAPSPGRPAISALSFDEYVGRKHLLISSGGVTGIVDEVLTVVGQERHFAASTTHFAAVPFLLKGEDMVATLPTHAAHAIEQFGSLRVIPCPLALPSYSVELGWRTDALRDPAVALLKQCVLETFASLNWLNREPR